MNQAFTRQVAGDHYVGMGIQPIKFAMANGWDAGAFSILNYVSRHRSKAGLVDVEKALHFVELRQACAGYFLPCRGVISMQEYVTSNKIFEIDHAALLHLGWWVADQTDYQRKHLIECLNLLIAEYRKDELSQSALLL